MKLLFDTHAFIWWADNPSQLSPKVIAACKDQDNILFLSVASIWEIQIKVQIGKLKLKIGWEQLVQEEIEQNKLRLLPVIFKHIPELDRLPLHHRDPFDRLLIAQARVENALLISGDSAMDKYGVEMLW
jgi:PIN domain nuclease of toxin-antitoxin system